MKANPWFRMYSDFMFDEKIEFIAFEDQRHYVFILCMKNAGVLDKEYAQPGMLERVVSKRLGLYGEAFESAKKRLTEAGLIDSEFHPVAWDKRQFLSDGSAERTKAYRERMKRHSDVTVTVQETDTDTETEIDTDKEVDKKNTHAIARPDGVSSSVWSDFLQHRKTKKAAVTQTAIDGIAREAVKAGITLNDSLAMCCERGWVGFKAEWLIEKHGARTANPATKASPGKHTGFQNLDYKTGINEDGTFA